MKTIPNTWDIIKNTRDMVRESSLGQMDDVTKGNGGMANNMAQLS